MFQIEHLQTVHEQQTAHRSLLYQFLAQAFRFPDQILYKAVQDGALQDELLRICTGLPYTLSVALELQLQPPISYEALQTEYIRLFDVGTGGPPCPLYGGAYQDNRMKVMEELLRFYNHFGLTLSQDDKELPDHLSVTLEFLHYLTFKETLALHRQSHRLSYIRAQKDFIERHPGKWLPVLTRRLPAYNPLPFFAGLITFTTAFLQAEQEYLAEQLRGESS